jgi:murein L,D-transpeptidase YcbB/YkuD
LPPNPWPRAIFVNIPHFRLYALQTMDESEARMLRMNVVVGRTLDRLRTPTFVADMTHLIFRPYWEVPQSIAIQELLPAIRADARYLASHQLELVDAAGAVVSASGANLAAVAAGTVRLRQRPGAHNALGAVKFMMPNPNNVYLHDTPEQSLFSRSRRAFSHGCVRIADPPALARFVLADQPEWTTERISAAMSGGEPLRVELKEPVRVYFVYGTAIARESGEVLFFEDVYGLDGG